MGAGATGAFLNGFANAVSKKREYQAQRAAEDEAYVRRQRTAPGGSDPSAPAAVSGPAGSPAGKPTISSDPVADLPPYQKAFLNAIAGGESAGAYDVRYTPAGGVKFDLAGGHPRIYEEGPAGQSSAAGRYQFTWTTWKGTAGADTPFTPENQDRYAWQLAASDYARRTGRDLDADLQSGGLTQDMLKALTPTWASLGSDQDQRIADYNASLARYQPAPPAPAPQPRSILDFAALAPAQTQPAVPSDYPLGLALQ